MSQEYCYISPLHIWSDGASSFPISMIIITLGKLLRDFVFNLNFPAPEWKPLNEHCLYLLFTTCFVLSVMTAFTIYTCLYLHLYLKVIPPLHPNVINYKWVLTDIVIEKKVRKCCAHFHILVGQTYSCWSKSSKWIFLWEVLLYFLSALHTNRGKLG